jgi:hypothetical protein
MLIGRAAIKISRPHLWKINIIDYGKW